MKIFIKKNLGKVGSLLALSGVIFLGFRLKDYSSGLIINEISIEAWFVFILLTITYGCLGLLNAVSWKHNLRHCGAEISIIDSIYIYGISQLAKYLPGNIFQFAGRQALGMSKKINAKTLVKSTFWELFMLCFGGCILSMFMISVLIPNISSALLISMCLILVLLYFSGLKVAFSTSLATSALINLIFTFFSGVFFLMILKTLKIPINSLSELEIIGAFIFAWLIGLITPGAPAGVGIREVILLYLFKDSIDDANLLLAILLGRIMTISGDFIFYLISLSIGLISRFRKVKSV
ncbi:hypothetical protein ABXV16_08170 [Pantoea leporis]|uniref:Flippase-like domain-containing protein n=1 Tax=Pantoea leporis TaxID=2933780 RepID=A0ABV2DXH5_9GAMM